MSSFRARVKLLIEATIEGFTRACEIEFNNKKAVIIYAPILNRPGLPKDPNQFGPWISEEILKNLDQGSLHLDKNKPTTTQS